MLKHIQERKALYKWLSITPPSTQPLMQPLTSYFVREIPHNELYEKYTERLNTELDLIHKNNFEPIFLQVVHLLQHTKGIQHIIRGSAAGSLVSWMLGISHIDPI